jgi:hypothetical protein
MSKKIIGIHELAHDALIDNLSDLKIDTLISIGSPLGQKYVLHKILEEQLNLLISDKMDLFLTIIY